MVEIQIIDYIQFTIQNQLKNLKKDIEQLPQATNKQKNQIANQCQKSLKYLRSMFEKYNLQISQLQGQGRSYHLSKFQQHKAKYRSLQNLLQYNLNDNHAQQNQLFLNRSKTPQPKPSSQQQTLIQQGHKIQTEQQQTLHNIRKDVQKMQIMADNINTQLNRQINMLDEAYDNMRDTQTTLKRAQEHLRNFARQVYGDRLMLCLIVVIVVAIIVIVVLKIIGKVPQVSIDQIK